MDLDPKSLMIPSWPPSRRGIALPVALLALVGMAAIPSALLTIAWAQGRAERNRIDQALAMEIAEAGTAHAIGLIGTKLRAVSFTSMLRGADGTSNTADDGLLIGFNLPTAEQIPAAGKVFVDETTNLGTYRVQIINDPEEGVNSPHTDLNNRIVVRCVGETRAGASATVNLVWTRLDPLRVAVATGGNLRVDNLQVNGGCKDVYVGDTLDFGNNTGLTGSEGGGGGTTWLLPPGGSRKAPAPAGTQTDLSRALNLPTDATPASQCPTGGIVRTTSIGTPAAPQDLATLPAGVYCVQGGSVYVRASGALSPNVAFIADGHISIEHTPGGNNRLTLGRKLNDGTGLHAGGDIRVVGRVRVDGNIYCRSQFDMQGLDMGGQLVCADEPDPPETVVGGTQSCAAPLSGTCPRSIAGQAGFGGTARPALSIFRSATGNTDGNRIQFSCQAKYLKPGYELSRVAWYPTFGS